MSRQSSVVVVYLSGMGRRNCQTDAEGRKPLGMPILWREMGLCRLDECSPGEVTNESAVKRWHRRPWVSCEKQTKPVSKPA